MPNLSYDFAGGGAFTATTIVTTGSITSGDDLTATDDLFVGDDATIGDLLTAARITVPLLGTTSAADLVLQRNSLEICRLASTALAVKLGNTFDLYNVGAPGDANFELLRLNFSSNVAQFIAVAGGTGTNRNIQMLTADGSGLKCNVNGQSSLNNSAGGQHGLTAAADAVGLNITGKITTGATAGISLGNSSFGTGFAASSGTQKLIVSSMTLNQSGTAGYTLIEGTATQTTTGSGAKRLLDLIVGASSQFIVNNSGSINSRGGLGLQTPAAAKTADFTFTANDFYVRFDTSGGALNANLPAASSSRGFIYVIRRAGANNLTIDPNGAETIDGAATLVVADATQRSIICDGANWFTLQAGT